MVKVVHLKIQTINDRICGLQNLLKEGNTQLNKTKRKRIYQQLAQLKKAINDPEKLTVDPQIKQQKILQDKKRRIQKKLDKKKQIVKEVKKEKRYQKKCLQCGQTGHLLAECTKTQGGGYCYRCGATDHNHKQCRMHGYQQAVCFYCGSKGHIARECQSNEKGMYVKGGSCFGCGSVRHSLKDCPVRHKGATYENKQQF